MKPLHSFPNAASGGLCTLRAWAARGGGQAVAQAALWFVASRASPGSQLGLLGAGGRVKMVASLCRLQNRTKMALLEQLQAELSCSQQAHQAQMEQLRGRLQCLQQELERCQGGPQDGLCQLLACKSPQEEQGQDRELLLQQCQLLKDQVGPVASCPRPEPLPPHLPLGSSSLLAPRSSSTTRR